MNKSVFILLALAAAFTLAGPTATWAKPVSGMIIPDTLAGQS